MSTTVTSEQVEGIVREALVKFGTPVEAITPDATFEALDVDSLDLVEMAQIIEEEFGVELTASDVKGIATMGELVNLIVTRT
ncbi:MAG TPA: phosphopantetheine-binding protein [Solirubrobacteraceae bacterium]|jgi:acyl carrier protein|nr:phosphopantetheine-binding protein [Solirubrobacteraceae bacterium]